MSFVPQSVEQLLDRAKRHAPDWRITMYEQLKHEAGISVKLGTWEVVMGRNKPDMVITEKSTCLVHALHQCIMKAEHIDEVVDKE